MRDRCYGRAMHQSFLRYAEGLHPSFERLTTMAPVTIPTLPRDAPSEGIYLLGEKGRHLYVGRTRRLRNRLREHSIPSAQHNQAVFAFRLAREMTGRMMADYAGEGRRAALVMNDPEFMAAFRAAKARVRAMEVRYVEEKDPLRQALLEIYVAVVCGTPYNDFNTS
jgi:predicted GIY-YIG superfamily endonuclease